jgi:hypothetical protein
MSRRATDAKVALENAGFQVVFLRYFGHETFHVYFNHRLVSKLDVYKGMVDNIKVVNLLGYRGFDENGRKKGNDYGL